MSGMLNRREMIARSLRAAAVMAGGGLTGFASRPGLTAPAIVDKSKTAPTSPVAIQRCATYEPKAVRQRLDAALDMIGGLGKLVRDKTVTIKLNMTGPVQELVGRPASETYQIHPNVVGALCAALNDAGARRIHLVEALYYKESIEEVLKMAGWDYAAIQAAGGHKVSAENTKNMGRWKEYGEIKVPWGGYLFPAFKVNQSYVKTDVFISLAKLKNHECAGVTMAVKNLFGVTPTALYGNDAPNEETVSARVAMLHEAKRTVPDGVPGELGSERVMGWERRVPRITADLMGARPVDLAVIDGIHTITGGEGPWNQGVAATEPNLLLVGRNAVCTDAVCTAVMGYDARTPHFEFPFPGENHLLLAAQGGVGTIDVSRIEVAGLPIEKAKHPFKQPPAAEKAA